MSEPPFELDPFDRPQVARVASERGGTRPPGRVGRPLELVDLKAGAGEPKQPAVAVEPQTVAPPPPAHSEEELAAAVAAAHAETAASTERRVRSELLNERAQRQVEALEAISRDLAVIAAADRAAGEEQGRVAAGLGLAIARAIVPRALAQEPLADVDAMLRDVVGRLEGEPVLDLRLPEDLVEPGRRLLEEIAARTGFRGRLEIAGDRQMAPGDACLLWRHGRAERRIERIASEAEALARAWLPGNEQPKGVTFPEPARLDHATEGRDHE